MAIGIDIPIKKNRIFIVNGIEYLNDSQYLYTARDCNYHFISFRKPQVKAAKGRFNIGDTLTK